MTGLTERRGNVEITRPVLRYFGGKWKASPWIVSQFPPHRLYVEPFGGGASVLIRKPRSFAEVYNDVDKEIVNVFQVLRDEASAEKLRHLLELTPYAREEFFEAFEQSEDPVEQARRTLVKSYCGYGSDSIFRNRNTGFRADTTRKGHIPAHDWASYPRMVGKFCERLQGVVIENRPAMEIIKRYDCRDVLFYVDPPYVPVSRKDAAHGYRFEMSEQDHRSLGEALKSLQGMTVLSGYRSELYDELFSDWRRLERVSAGQFSGETVTECVWISPNVPIRQGVLL